ncbi:NAD(P)-dependent oxidoreductase [Pseudaminobacter arsenicus]|uniref:NAD(P)-dependent oxidoreductase n=1 Tax=Borborobacter arsenicus TaxID=1851146 RepID=A0A432V3A0_9HYPH|nr:NAD(P)-dependent oxidoreductase [Pseudaminobacter arsenicus]RUM96679.1 NAD(P)-dependent oxidoreductase [Pseudaminobacter arsenicus]
MTILVTGAGAIGMKTAELLLACGKTVIVADVRPVDLGEQKPDGLSFEVCDILDRQALDALVSAYKVDEIVHTAALLSTAIRLDPPKGVLVNTVGTANILEIARQRGLRRVVIASSTTVGYTAFASHDNSPIEEDLALRIVSQRPASIYAATKIAAEHLALVYHDLYGVDVVVLRYGAVLSGGAGLATSVPGRLLATLLAAGEARREAVIDDPFLVWDGREEFVDMRDCAEANVAALHADRPGSRVYNIATGEWYSFDQFCDAVRAIYPDLRVRLKIPPTGGFAGFPYLRPAPSDIRLAADELGFKAKYSLHKTIEDYAK